jgi:uncharacterized protein (TIGR03086 family)
MGLTTNPPTTGPAAPPVANDTTLTLLRRAVTGFGALVAQVPSSAWDRTTPCADWNVRALVNHVTVENLWAAELFAGRAIVEVGDSLDGDQLGAVPLARWEQASRSALAAAGTHGAMAGTVHLSFGDVPGHEYAMQLFADHLVHRWDLAVALADGPAVLPSADVQVCLAWFAGHEHDYRAAGVIGPRPPLPADADPTTRLLAAFGRTA